MNKLRRFVRIIVFFWVFLDVIYVLAAIIPGCVEEQLGICVRCQKGLVLNADASQCQENSSFHSYCTQVSVLKTCMRCDRGYVLNSNTDTCILSNVSFFGCEIVERDGVCVRPKSQFTLLKGLATMNYIMFARGSNCEIRSLESGKCEQCHSGYLLDERNECKYQNSRLVNEFFSFYDNEGHIKSRSSQFIPGDDGVFPTIPYCKVQKIRKDSMTSECQVCDQTKIPNSSKSGCFKPPFEQCGRVDDEDHFKCQECLDNDYFYLVQKEGEQACLPRLNKDYSTKCLEYFSGSMHCKKCAPGLILSFDGCGLEEFGEIQEGLLKENENYQRKELQERFNWFTCEYWKDKHTCASCIKEMILDTQGHCQLKTDDNCETASSEDGSCFRCIDLMYYSQQQGKCVDISDDKCKHSSGTADSCETCHQKNYLDEKGKCEGNLIEGCEISNESEKVCILCFQLFYLNSYSFCSPIDDKDQCTFSDGLHNYCLQCKPYYLRDDQGLCSWTQLLSEIKPKQDQQQQFKCLQNSYFDPLLNRCLVCLNFNKGECLRFHSNKNECLLCIKGFFLNKGVCERNYLCQLTNGIDEWCYQAVHLSNFIDDKGVIQQATKWCFTNGIENLCTICETADHQLGLNLGVECKPIHSLNINISQNCLRLRKLDDSNLGCELCESLFYPDSAGSCASLDDTHCEFSKGRENRCELCQRGFTFTEKDSRGSHVCTEEAIFPILFCKTMKGIDCVKCENLFHINGLVCLPISDPECIESDGIYDTCLKCKNTFKNSLTLSNQCDLVGCSQRSPTTGICEKCMSGFALKKIISLPFAWNNQIEVKKLFFINILRLESTQDSNMPLNRLNQGGRVDYYCILYYQQEFYECRSELDQDCIEYEFHICIKCRPGLYLKNFKTIKVCMAIPVENCLDMDLTGRECVKCQDQYVLLPNGKCTRLIGCSEFSDGQCLKCTENYWLKNGKCMFIPHCMIQKDQNCVQCDDGFWLDRTIDFVQGAHELLNVCRKIPHCLLSDGQSSVCLDCKQRFVLVKGICILDKTRVEIVENCWKYQQDKAYSECIQCRNLYFLKSGVCMKMQGLGCQENGGVTSSCALCSFDGFRLLANLECEKIPYCAVSNGINMCIICEADYAAESNGNCTEIREKIDKCEVYAFGQTAAVNCVKCSNFYYLSEQLGRQICTQMESFLTRNCFQSNGILPRCEVCQKGMSPKLKTEISGNFACYSSKRFYTGPNIGCSLQSFFGDCLECFDSFYLDKNRLCVAKNRSKCLSYYPFSDNCLICKSGWVLRQLNGSSICFRLGKEQRVENCVEYQANTNKCIKCRKDLPQQDVIEFFLDEETNTCVYVLDLMCRLANKIQDKIECTQKYIPNCEIYGRQDNGLQLCSKCSNGFYQESGGSCAKSAEIAHCLVYSQTENARCLLCQNLYFVSSLKGTCLPVSRANCKLSSKDKDACEICNEQQTSAINIVITFQQQSFWQNRFTLEDGSRDCIKSTIPNCYLLQQRTIGSLNESMNTICLKCIYNFAVVSSGTACELRQDDPYCLKLQRNNSQQCQICKEGYLLNNQNDCISIPNQSFALDNCVEYSKDSNADYYYCQTCQENYSLDDQQNCVPLDPDSNLESPEEIQPQLTQEGQSNTYLYLLVCFLLLAFLVVFIISHSRKKLKSTQNRRQELEEESSYVIAQIQMEATFQIQQQQQHQENEYFDNQDNPNL